MAQFSEQEEKRIEELANMAFNFARNNEKESLETMLKAGLSSNLKNHKGDSLLMLASYHGNYECVKMLLEYGARVDEKNDRGQTPLAGVCFKGYKDIAELLVKYGANIDANNGLGMTPFSFAVMFGRKEVADFLAQHSKKTFKKKIALKFLSLFKK